jgi:hypothetical protein
MGERIDDFLTNKTYKCNLFKYRKVCSEEDSLRGNIVTNGRNDKERGERLISPYPEYPGFPLSQEDC